MKTKLLSCLLVLLVMACTEKPVQDTPPEEIEATTVTQTAPAANQESDATETDEVLAAKWQECLDYFESIRISDTERLAYLDQLLQDKKGRLTANNRKFLVQLKKDWTNHASKQPQLTIEQSLFAVFRIPDQKLGIIGQRVPDMDRPSELTDLSAEDALLEKWAGPKWANSEGTRLMHYPELLESIYPAGKPQLYLYTTKTTRTSKVKELGYYQDDCSGYYHYTFDEQALQASDEVLFASRLPLDLIYENNPDFDKWYTRNMRPECADCPSSHDLSVSVAKLTGTENMYFVYADAFPDNRKLHTPFRALIAKMEDGRRLYLWSSDIDNFGCSCL